MMFRGEGPTANKFWKYVGRDCYIIEVGTSTRFKTLDDLKAGQYNPAWNASEIAEIIAVFEPPKEEAVDAPASDAKRGPGRPRKADRETDSAPEVSQNGAR
jgi:hypothetical protein